MILAVHLTMGRGPRTHPVRSTRLRAPGVTTGWHPSRAGESYGPHYALDRRQLHPEIYAKTIEELQRVTAPASEDDACTGLGHSPKTGGLKTSSSGGRGNGCGRGSGGTAESKMPSLVV